MLQLLQLLHRTLAVILPFDIPEPSSKAMSVAPLYVGMMWPVVFLGEIVTFWPFAELYMRKMLALLIIVPCARATQAYVVGADNWK